MDSLAGGVDDWGGTGATFLVSEVILHLDLGGSYTDTSHIISVELDVGDTSLNEYVYLK